MKIGIFTNNYLPNPYGVSMSIESFRQQFEKRGHKVYIFAPKYRGYQDENPNVFRYPSIDVKYKISFPLAFPHSHKISRIIKNLDLDIIHSQHPNLLGGEASKWARKKNIPLVFTWHTLYDQYVHFVPLIPKKWAGRWIIKKAADYANQSDVVVIPTESVREIIRGWGVYNGNITAVPTGVEEEVYQNPDRNFVREKYGIVQDDVLLLLVSRLTQEKNIEFLFDSLILVLRNNHNVKFIVAGDGHLVPELKAKIKKYNLEDKVIFESIVKKTEIKNYYAAADIFVYASKSETQGMIVSEAMYMGLPVVALRATGIKDLVRDKVTGYLVDEDEKEFGEAVTKLIANKSLRESFSAEAKKIARGNLTDTACAVKMLEVYERAINNRKIKNAR